MDKKICCVENCKNTSTNNPDIPYVRFPLGSKKNAWRQILTLKPVRDLVGIIPHVCSAHFDPSCFRGSLLKKNALPFGNKKGDKQSNEKTMTPIKRTRSNTILRSASETDDLSNLASNSSSADNNVVEIISDFAENMPLENEDHVIMDMDNTPDVQQDNRIVVVQTNTESSTGYQNFDLMTIPYDKSPSPSITTTATPTTTATHNHIDQNDEGFSFSELLQYVQQYIMQPLSKVNPSADEDDDAAGGGGGGGTAPQPPVINQDDEYTIFGDYLKIKLNKFTVDQRNMAEYLISKVLFEADIGRFKHTIIK